MLLFPMLNKIIKIKVIGYCKTGHCCHTLLYDWTVNEFNNIKVIASMLEIIFTLKALSLLKRQLYDSTGN